MSSCCDNICYCHCGCHCHCHCHCHLACCLTYITVSVRSECQRCFAALASGLCPGYAVRLECMSVVPYCVAPLSYALYLSVNNSLRKQNSSGCVNRSCYRAHLAPVTSAVCVRALCRHSRRHRYRQAMPRTYIFVGLTFHLFFVCMCACVCCV